MTINSLAPGFIKLYYLGPQNIQHVMTIPVAINNVNVTPITIDQRDLTAVSWITGVTAYVNILKAVMASTVTFQFAELWTQPTAADDPVFRETTSLNIVGTYATASLSNSQVTYSFRTQSGGVGKVVLLEQSDPVNTVYKAPTYGNAAKLAVVNYLIGTTDIVVGRDGGFPVNIPRILTKTNDPMRKKTVLGAP